MANPTYHAQDVVQGVFNVLTTAKTTLGLQDIWYGDQANIPRTPAVCVEPSITRRKIHSAANLPRTENEFNVLVMVYVSLLSDSGTIEKTKDLLLDQVCDTLNTDYTLGGLVLWGLTSECDPGYNLKGGKLFRVGKIVYSGMNISWLTNPV